MNKVAIDTAVAALKQGEVLAYPTESVWGLGCDPFNEEAFNNLLALKARAMEKGVILVAGHTDQVMPYLTELADSVVEKIVASWQLDKAVSSSDQQATTWLVPLQKKAHQSAIPTWITGKHDSIALRVTPHPQVQALCHAFGSVLVSTSCNPSGSDPATTLEQAQNYFSDSVHYLEGDTLGFGKPSRILDARTGAILR